ncbi:putative membrane protein SpoIIM required for sporulation [Pseudomonas duriflava]|uniref:Putative membrane protein SpoIIM required for sporulation n=1 Tax=Pseudomonas duriflava TaxID=459528 RepID=A0A562QP76_9PSED|nr:stage II sporulation protein M [Pseudomonas duriflava]TWI58534.1 putative membrane protein SpoIIM required for sporulation [Pseudomonas duriflava]
MKQSPFEHRYQAEWVRFDEHLGLLEKRRPLASPEDIKRFAANYRRLCQHLALAQARGYSPGLVDRLRQLTLRGHQQLYRHRGNPGQRLIRFLLTDFPQLVREEWRAVAAASLLFYGSLLVMGVLIYYVPDLVYSLLDPAQVADMESMYAPDAKRIGALPERASSQDWQMFGYYIRHNIGIAFQTFAGGLLYGLGSLFFLLFNGMTIGAVAGYLTQLGSGVTFWPFVIGHGAFELTAITLAGAAGLKLGAALVAPGRQRRSEALRLAARRCVGLVIGVTILLVLAAFTEAYWSSSAALSVWIKYSVGALLWLAVGAYFICLGRDSHASDR